jgi:membrane-bound lytic murein transglycosylase B
MSRATDQRIVFILLLLAGCADPQVTPPVLTPGAILQPPAAAPAATPAPPAPVSIPSSGDMSFDQWRAQFAPKAVVAGVPLEVVQRELAGLTPDAQVVSLDRRQPEFSRPIGDYIKGTVSDARIAQGRDFRTSLAFLPDVEARFGVPREILLSVWAMESGFGKIQGTSDVVRSLATLAADGRRRDFAEGELIAALKIIASGEATRMQMKGSWAGAMGQTQFIPSNFFPTAIDEDGDGKRDIWGSNADSLASAANLLAKGGWRRGEGWAREVILPPNFDYSLAEGPREPWAAWQARGLKRADGLPWTAADAVAPSQLLLPAGAAGPAFLALPNHFAIRKYNNSVAYALAVGLMADRFGGEGPLVTPWPVEQPLSLADRIAAQGALARLGFNPGPADGVVGAGTRTALRAWQKARGLPADGYLSLDLVKRLSLEAANAATTPG